MIVLAGDYDFCQFYVGEAEVRFNEYGGIMLTTKNYMTRDVFTITNDQSVLEAYKLMCTKNIRHLPVVDKDGIVTGVLSDRDVQRAMIVDLDEVFLNAKKLVADYMSPIAFTALSDSPLTAIIQEMMEKKISAVVIVDESLKCVGIVTTNDIMRVFLKHLDHDHEIFGKPISFFTPNILY
jgi:CBS domain-containing protein